MTSWTHRTLIVPDGQVEFARSLTATIAGPSGAGMWSTPLSPTGTLPATHWISSGLIDAQFAAMLPLTERPADGGPVHTPGQHGICAHLATEAGMPTKHTRVAALFAKADVSAEDAQTAMARLGLKIAKPIESETV